MNRWAVRMMGLLMVLIFLLVFAQMYRTLVALQRRQAPAATSTATATTAP